MTINTRQARLHRIFIKSAQLKRFGLFSASVNFCEDCATSSSQPHILITNASNTETCDIPVTEIN